MVAPNEELITLVAGLSDAVVAVDLERQPLFWNSPFALSFGFRPENTGVKLTEFIKHPDFVEALRFTIEEEKNYRLKVFSHTVDDRKKFFSLSVSPLRNSKKKMYGALAIFHDVTEMKMAEQMRIDFVANVSHEVRTPLTSIKGYTDTLIGDLEKKIPADPRFLVAIRRNTDRLMALIQDLLDLSTLEYGKRQFMRERLNTVEVTQRILSQMESQFQQKLQKISCVYNAQFVLADEKLLEQVLVNLLINASKYSPQESQIEIVWEENHEGDTLLRVRDNGPGIAPEHHDRLFERFYRIDFGRTRETGGTGLGLAIVKQIINRQHGGAVWVESELGKGAMFTCQFPGT